MPADDKPHNDLEPNWLDEAEQYVDKEPEQSIQFSSGSGRKYVAYTVKLPSQQLAALQSIWLELKRMYGTHSPDKSGMIQQAIGEWLKKWDGPERPELLRQLLQIREDTRKRQYRKIP